MSHRLVTQISPVVECERPSEIRVLMERLDVVRADTYNKLGSLKGWGLDWHKAYAIIRNLKDASEYQVPSKLCEWTVNDVVKAILAQQEAARTAVIKQIYRKFSDEAVRVELIKKLYSREWLNHPWLHRQMRKAYKRGHSYVNNQIVYQNRREWGMGNGEWGMTSLFTNGQWLMANCKKRQTFSLATFPLPVSNAPFPIPYSPFPISSAFVSSEGTTYGAGLGKKLTAKTERIHKKNQQRQKLWALYNKNLVNNPKKAQNIKDNNLSRKAENRKLARDKAEIKGLIRYGVRQMLHAPTLVYAEDLSKHFTTKKQSKAVNRKLNSWMKGELQKSLESIAQQTGSNIKIVNPAYTSQVDFVTGTLLGFRDGDSFTRFTGVVLQADINAAKNILCRGTDTEICRYMKSDKVLEVLLDRTVRFLAPFGWTVADVVNRGWLQSKFTAKATALEAKIAPCGVQGTSRKTRERRTKKSPPTVQAVQLTLWDISSHSENNTPPADLA